MDKIRGWIQHSWKYDNNVPMFHIANFLSSNVRSCSFLLSLYLRGVWHLIVRRCWNQRYCTGRVIAYSIFIKLTQKKKSSYFHLKIDDASSKMNRQFLHFRKLLVAKIYHAWVILFEGVLSSVFGPEEICVQIFIRKVFTNLESRMSCLRN